MLSPRSGVRHLLAGALLLLGIARAGLGEPAVTLVANGDPANRVDLVFVGDGYTAAEMGKYGLDVQRITQEMFSQEPLRAYQRYFNVHRVEMVSSESGADHPERRPPVARNTAFDAAYNCAGIQRLICVDNGKVSTVLARSLPREQRDLVVVIVNDGEYGGSGGSVVVASTHQAAVELVLHELGHTFGLLADEYGGNSGPACDPSREPPEANATKENRRETIKWNLWVGGSASFPSTDALPGIPGLYQGARYCDRGLFRPTFNSKMRSLGQPFEAINSEQLIKRIYNGVSLLEASEPSEDQVTVARGQSRLFRVTTPTPLSHALTIQWLVDGQVRGSALAFPLDTTALSAGAHVVEVVVQDPTPLVRKDPSQLLIERRKWTVTVQ